MNDYELIISFLSSKKKLQNDEGCKIINKILENSDKNESILRKLFTHLENCLKSDIVDNQCFAIHLAICLFSHSNFLKLQMFSHESKFNILKSIFLLVCNQNQEIRLNSNLFIKQSCLTEPVLFMQLASETFFHEINLINNKLSSINAIKNESIYFNLAKELDNMIQCLKYIVDAYTMSIDTHITKQFIDCIKLSINCEDRLTRESLFYLLLSLMKSQEFFMDINLLLLDEIVKIILLGLADNFCQVRLPACLNAKEFCSHVIDDVKKKYLIILLPGLCLNRYYTAQGVSNLSQEIWQKETLGQGQALVEENFSSLISFYENQLEMTNYEIQDTVSICINEVLLKLNKNIVLPYIERILKMVDKLMSHWHWSVRDSACITVSSLFRIFNQDCNLHVEAFTNKLFELLVEYSPRVREAAAIALANVLNICEQEFQMKIINNIDKFFIEMFKQDNFVEEILSPSNSKNKMMKLENTCIEICQDNSNELFIQEPFHPDISFNSVNTINKSNEDASSIITVCKRSSENWELIEGYLCLICQLSKYKEHTEITIKYLLKIKDLLEKRNYLKSSFLMQSFLKQLPEVFANLEKVYLKRYLEDFFDLIFGNVSSSNDELASSSRECILIISKQFGQNMFKMRVEKYNPNYTKFC